MNDVICKTCGYSGERQYDNPGSLSVEVVLWLLLIVPGLIYSLWRHLSAVPVCPKCGGRELIPLDSPLGRKLANDVGHIMVPAAPLPATYKPTTSRKGGLAWKTGRLFGRLLGRR
jgi:hypothetical protein